MKKPVEVLVRALIQEKGKVLVCKKLGRNYYFFPGGHLEFGESLHQALIREIKEELGLGIEKCSFIGGSEHLFAEDGKKNHEINLAFDVKVNKLKFKSQENHLQFLLLNKKQIAEEKVLPKVLTQAVLKWLKNKKTFWVSQIS